MTAPVDSGVAIPEMSFHHYLKEVSAMTEMYA